MTTSSTPGPAARAGTGSIDDSPDNATLHRDLVRVLRTLRAVGSSGDLSAGLSSALWTVLNHGPLRLSTLAECESVSMPTASRIVADLEQRGYVERTSDPDDGRARLIRATSDGAAVINTSRSAKALLLSRAVASLDPDTRAHLAPAVAALADALGATILTEPDLPGPAPGD
jgi:DNA-binding MarR family transcriptional regulator